MSASRMTPAPLSAALSDRKVAVCNLIASAPENAGPSSAGAWPLMGFTAQNSSQSVAAAAWVDPPRTAAATLA